MGCDKFDLGGATLIVCSRGQRQRRCSTAGCQNRASLLCDFAVTRKGKAGTCDRPVCKPCAKNVGPDRDYCAAHARVEAKP